VRVALQISLALWVMIGCAIVEVQRVLEVSNNKARNPARAAGTLYLTMESDPHGSTIIAAEP
jgi:hypothetical protein